MNYAQPTDETGRLEARYSAVLETITSLRPSLRRYLRAHDRFDDKREGQNHTNATGHVGARSRMLTHRFDVNCMFNFRTGNELGVLSYS